MKSRGKKGREIQIEVGKMQSKGRQRKAEAEWLARREKQRQEGGSQMAGRGRVAEQQEARKVFKRKAKATKRQTEACTLAEIYKQR